MRDLLDPHASRLSMRISSLIRALVWYAGSWWALSAAVGLISSGSVTSLSLFAVLCLAGSVSLALCIRAVLRAVFARAFRVHSRGAVVISGTSSGIGRHAALEIARRGFIVYAGVRRERDAESLRGEGVAGIRPVLLDVASSPSVRKACERITKELRSESLPLVGLVNNAGISEGLPVELEPLDSVRRCFEVNTFGVFRLTRTLIPLLRASGGRIVNIGSVAGFISRPMKATYSGTKFGLEGITDSLRLELQRFGVSVSIIRPAYVKTAITRKQVGENSSFRKLPADDYKLYASIFDKFDAKRKRMGARAASPRVTTDAICHALTAKYPETRYTIAKVGALPAWLIAWVKWLLPDRVFDAIQGSR